MVRLVISRVYTVKVILVSEHSKASHLMIYSAGKTAEVMVYIWVNHLVTISVLFSQTGGSAPTLPHFNSHSLTLLSTLICFTCLARSPQHC